MELDCGIRRERIAAWLDEELKLPLDGSAWVFAFAGDSCRVSASPLESRIFGGIEIERTLLVAQGGQTAVDEFQRRFTLRFVSAGG